MVMSKRDVIVCRGVWYVMVVLSLLGLSISLNLLWPAGGKPSSRSRFSRDGAVSATTFYGVTLLRFLFFTDLPTSTTASFYRDFTTRGEKIPQVIFAEFAILAIVVSPLLSRIVVDDFSIVLKFSLFTVSLFTGGIGLIQLSEKFRMEMRHAYFTLFFTLFASLIGLYISTGQNFSFSSLYMLTSFFNHYQIILEFRNSNY
ncbi:hypothetical protein CARUB_v10002668mg [Capsella rubella]|uniref:Uncharacterized protein n=1 Tax=Capsella rubella TaxID=81985 RepID=R0FBZ2_9BRAS|nr:hypothetical protein CARUB_v10002668mg [Capsella rubella]